MSDDTPTCRIHEKYKWIECTNTPLNGDSDGFCILHSKNKAKNLDAFKEAVQARCEQDESQKYDFRGVYFPTLFPFEGLRFWETQEVNKDIDFSEATFMGEAFFFLTTFKGRAVFNGATFVERAFCLDASFINDADFCNATFMKEANFSGAKFLENASFSNAAFRGETDFGHVTFVKKAKFEEAIFAGKADFHWANFMKWANFSGTKIQGRLVFYACNSLLPKTTEPLRGEFRRLVLTQGSILRFQDIYLGQVSFRDSDLRQIEFHHVQWNHYKGRQATYDEVELRQNEGSWYSEWLLNYAPYTNFHHSVGDTYGEAERLYRDLQANYEKIRDYKRMGDFHYGEMEMHRRASKWRWFPFYWYNLYWALSGYGERPSRAFGWLAAFLIVFTSLLGWAGLDLDPKHTPAFGDSFFYLLQKVTLQRPTWAEPQGFWGKLVAGFSVLLIPGQAALFLLALRNRLGRRR